jgi:SPP1 gp7 family putative phage head morphogenesis protein
MLRAQVPNVTALAKAVVAEPGKVKTLVRKAMADPDPSALEALYRKAWKAGTTAAEAITGTAKADAATATPSVLAELLKLAGAIWGSIADWTGDRIATVVTEALSSDDHADVRSIAKQINAVLDDPDRAHMIAQTECTRAMTGAALATYKDFGAEQIEFLTADDTDVDDLCAANEDHGPIDIDGGTFPNGMPPVHPRCRCTVIPAE